MAWTFNGASGAADVGGVIAVSPFLIKKIVVVADDGTAAECVHGETTSPDMVLLSCYQDSPVDVSYLAASAVTKVKFDAAGACTFHAFCIWFNHHSGGLTNVS